MVQRLFSTFAAGCPGAGLLLLRLLRGAALIHSGIDGIPGGPSPLTVVLQVIDMAAPMLLLVGMLTPVAGVLAAATKVWIAILRFSAHSGDPWVALAEAVLAMIAPGAWSIDARRFGKQHIAP